VIHPKKMLPAPSSRRGWKTSGDILKLCRSISSYAASVMEYLGRFNPMKEILPSEFACNSGPTHGVAVSIGNMRTCMCTEGNMEHARSNIFLSQLIQRVKSQVIIFFYLLLLDIGSNCARETNFCILMIHGIFWTRTGEQIIIMFLYSKIIYFRCVPDADSPEAQNWSHFRFLTSTPL
jgi:hypothetical protein